VGQSTQVDVQFFPMDGASFFVGVKNGRARRWCADLAREIIADARHGQGQVTLGWGAMTKNATGHGQAMVDSGQPLPRNLASTHGDAGSVALVMAALRQAGVGPGDRVAVLGATGAIGDAVSRMLPDLQPESVVLVGRPDLAGQTCRRRRLEGLRRRVRESSPRRTPVWVAQHVERACLAHRCNVIIVATTGVTLEPAWIPEGAVLLDITTPSACRPGPGWEGRLVLRAGCGRFEDPSLLPEGFGDVAGLRLTDVGAGGEHVLWGCLLETIARSVFGWRGHLTGTDIPLDAVRWCDRRFEQLSIRPQPFETNSGVGLTRAQVRAFIRAGRQPLHARSSYSESTKKVQPERSTLLCLSRYGTL